MIDTSKVVVYPLKDCEYVDLDQGKRVKFTMQKTDKAFSSFIQADSVSSRFATSVAENEILRTFFFLRSTIIPSVDQKYPIGEHFPIILDPSYDVSKNVSDFEKAKKEKEDERKKLTEEFHNELDAAYFKLLSLVYGDPEVAKALNTGRKPAISKALDNAFKKHEKEMVELSAKFIEFTGYAYQINSYSILSYFIGNIELAQTNSKILSRILNLPSESTRLFSAFNFLASKKVLKVETQSYCIDCYFKYGEEPYFSYSSNFKEMNLPARCPQCKEPGIFHDVIIRYPIGLHKIVMPQTNWLREIIIGYTLSTLPKVKKVFVHKKVHNAPRNANEGEGVESDVSLITEDNKLVLIEVTTKSDLNNITKDTQNKLKNLEEKNIPFYSLGIITSSETPRFLTFNEKPRVTIFSASHISKITDFVQNELIMK